MKVFIAGATGAIGQPLVQGLLAAGHEVFGMTRSKENASTLSRQGAEPVLIDVLDAAAVRSSINSIQPEAVIDQLTSLPKDYTREALQHSAPIDKRTRLEGGENVLAAAQSTGVKRYMIQSAAFFYAPGNGLADENATFAFDGPPSIAGNTRTFDEMEKRTLATGLESLILRYGFFYGPRTWYGKNGSVEEQIRNGVFPILGNGEGVWSFVHVEDAADATVKALDSANPGIYNIVDDNPSKVSVWLPAYANWLGAPEPAHLDVEKVSDSNFVYYETHLRGASNAKAKRELSWQPRKLEWLGSI